jgi:hypothetical protein
MIVALRADQSYFRIQLFIQAHKTESSAINFMILRAVESQWMHITTPKRPGVLQALPSRPQWHQNDDERGAVQIAVSGSACDPLEWQDHTSSYARDT